MLFPFWMSFMRRTRSRVHVLSCVAVFAAGFAGAQTTVSPNQSSPDQSKSAAYSSSSDAGLPQFAELAAPSGMAALPSAPQPASSSAGAQESGGGGGGWRHGMLSNYALEFSGGFNAPAGDKTYITWGGQFTIGGGMNFSKRYALLAEYQFIDDKIPGQIIAEAGAQGGHAHIWSFTLDPVVSLFPKSENDVYVTGGGGFYRKVTSFTDVEPTEVCYFYCGVGYAPQVVGHLSSNQGGFNIGGGYQHRMGGMYGDSKMKLFAEVRYVDVLTPAVTSQPNGLGTTTIAAGTKVLPISLGLRW